MEDRVWGGGGTGPLGKSKVICGEVRSLQNIVSLPWFEGETFRLNCFSTLRLLNLPCKTTFSIMTHSVGLLSSKLCLKHMYGTSSRNNDVSRYVVIIKSLDSILSIQMEPNHNNGVLVERGRDLLRRVCLLKVQRNLKDNLDTI